MTLVKEKRREVVIEKDRSRSLGLVKYLVPCAIVFALVFGTYSINAKTANLENQISMFRENLALIEQQDESLNMQIGKMTVGLDVIN
ncbi:MAG: hypothetical protein KBH80_05430 [Fervidobacterium sp.]|nr:hypothetical protein [Fervidobacterium sp.]